MGVDYACSAWYSGLNKNLEISFRLLKTRLLDLLTEQEAPKYNVNLHVLAELNLLKVEARVSQLRLNHAFKIFHGTSPSYLQENFSKGFDNHEYNTRSSLYNFSKT